MAVPYIYHSHVRSLRTVGEAEKLMDGFVSDLQKDLLYYKDDSILIGSKIEGCDAFLQRLDAYRRESLILIRQFQLFKQRLIGWLPDNMPCDLFTDDLCNMFESANEYHRKWDQLFSEIRIALDDTDKK